MAVPMEAERRVADQGQRQHGELWVHFSPNERARNMAARAYEPRIRLSVPPRVLPSMVA